MDTLIHTTLDAEGVLVATIDMPGRTMNVFSAGLMDALDALMDRADGDAAVRSVVLTSGKTNQRCFLKSGLRFSLNARTPSFDSSVW